jgi:hypothetical protein
VGLRSLAVLGSVVLAACGGGSANVVIPLFASGFGGTVMVGTDTHSISLFLSPQNPTTARGTFDATSRIEDSIGNTESPVTGTWSGCSFSMDVQAPSAALATHYEGSFSGKDDVLLVPGSAMLPALRLHRFLPSGADAPC